MMIPWSTVLALVGPFLVAYAVAMLAEVLLDASKEMWRTDRKRREPWLLK